MKLPRFLERKPRPKAPLSPRPIHGVFYAHSWSVYCLEALGLSVSKADVLVELATQSHLAHVLAPYNETRDSVLGLLQPQRHIHQLGQRYPGVVPAVVLAPVKPALASDVLNALALLANGHGPAGKALVMIHCADAALFAPAYAHMTDFSILWDVADVPDASLPALAQVLAGEHCLTQSRWAGFKLCHYERRPVADAEQRTAVLQTLLAQFPDLGD